MTICISALKSAFASSEYRNIVVNFGPLSLGNALSYPYDVATFLFLELHVRVEHSKVELLHEGMDVELYLPLKELVLKSLLPRVSTGTTEDGTIFLQEEELVVKEEEEEEEMEGYSQDSSRLQP